MNNLSLPPLGPAFPWLAPLAGHSDLPFRLLCREQGAAAACTEMISAKGLVYGEQEGKGFSATRKLLRTTPLPGLAPEADTPLVVQLFGDDPYFLGEAARLLHQWGYAFFDLNLGCSVPKVTKGGAGAALARNIRQTVRVAEAVLNAAPCPLGCKLRLGWNKAEENYLELGRELAEAGVSWLTLHPRYACQGFNGRADWAHLARLKEQVGIPVLASGDLVSAGDALRCLRETGADGVMFGRGALHNPAIFREFLQIPHRGGIPLPVKTPVVAFNGGSVVPPARRIANEAGEENRTKDHKAALKQLILRHAELFRAMETAAEADSPHFPRLRGAVLRYVRDLPGGRAFRQDLSLCAGWDMFYALLEQYFTAG